MLKVIWETSSENVLLIEVNSAHFLPSFALSVFDHEHESDDNDDDDDEWMNVCVHEQRKSER